jgi:hypothetical protein
MPSAAELLRRKKRHAERLAAQGGSKGEQSVTDRMPNWVMRPRGKRLRNLLTALEEAGTPIKWSSFDAIALPDPALNFLNADAVRRALPEMVFVEIKTARQARIESDFSGFFFAVTESEIVASEMLGSRHQVALYKGDSDDEPYMTTVAEILSRAKSMNWQVSVQL